MDILVATDRRWAIGRDGALLYHLPGDMRQFRSMTLGQTVLLGRKTLESFPGGRPLPGRRNIVLSSRDIPGVETVHTLEALVAAGGADEAAGKKVWVIGGGSVYAALLSRCEHCLVTRVGDTAENPDTWFPALDTLPDWQLEAISAPVTEKGLTYRFVTWRNTALSCTIHSAF